jgi:flavorubredoxin
MEARTDEIGDGIFRISTFMPHVLPPDGLTFNQFLILADEPMLFHCGHRRQFSNVSAAVAKLLPLDKLRWISFGHFEADECGAMNEWLAASPLARVVHGVVGCRVSIDDMADRAPLALSGGDTLELGGRRIRFIDTPHVPHGWDAGVVFEEETATLFCGDLFAHGGDRPALTASDIVEPATAILRYASTASPATAPIIRGLAKFEPRLLAVMHGSSYSGDTSAAINDLAAHYAAWLTAEMEGRGS